MSSSHWTPRCFPKFRGLTRKSFGRLSGAAHTLPVVGFDYRLTDFDHRRSEDDHRSRGTHHETPNARRALTPVWSSAADSGSTARAGSAHPAAAPGRPRGSLTGSGAAPRRAGRGLATRGAAWSPVGRRGVPG